MRSRSAALGGVALVYALILAAAAIPAWRPVMWGVHAWVSLPMTALAVIGTVAAGLIVLLLVAPPYPGAFLPAFAISLLSAPFLYLFRDTSHLLGDGQLWISVLAEQRAHHAHEPLAFALALVATLGKFMTSTVVESRMEIWSVVLGVIAVFLMIRIAARLADTAAGKWAAFGLLLGMGVLQFGFGYIESYPVFWVAVLLYVHLALEALLGRMSIVWTGLGLGFAAALHGSGFLLVPSFLWLIFVTRQSPAAMLISLLGAAVPVVFAYVGLPSILPTASAAAGSGKFNPRSWNRIFREFHLYSYGLPAWALGQINRWALASGAAIGLVVAGFAARRPPAKATAGTLPGGTVLFLALAALGMGIPAVLLDMEGSRGAAADWDAFSVAAVPLMALAAFLWAPEAGRSRTIRAGVAVIAALGLAAALSFVGVNASEKLALERFAGLADHVFITPRAKSWAYESLAVYYRNKQELPISADFYRKAVEYQTVNTRLIHNTASLYVQTKRYREASEMYLKLTKLEPRDPKVWFSLGAMLEQSGRTDSAIVAYRESLRLDPNFTDPMNYLARLLLQSPAGVEEARTLVRKSLEINPSQSTAGWAKETLRRLGEPVPEN